MATINLGAIKFNWKGAYNSSTSYAVDDVVSSGGNSYVCIQAHSTAQAVGDATAYWNIMSSAGTNGTDGTDLTSTLTTQGDILYRDGSGLQRLGAGTSGQVLQTGGTGANPSWNDASGGGLEFISKHNLSANTGEWIFDQVFANNTSFNVFEIYYYNLNHTDSSDNDLTMDLRKGASGSEVSVRSSTALFYHRIKQHGGSGGSAVHMQTDAAPHGGIRLAHSGTFGGADSRGTYGTITVFNPHRKDGNGNTIDSRCFVRATHQGLVSSNSSGSYMFSGETIANYDDNSLVATGFSLKSSDYNLRASSSCQSKVLIFGVKES